MRQLGEQWIENGRMYKVVLPGLCDGCDFNMGCLQNGGVNCKAGHCVTKQGHVKDLGPVNEDGLLGCPFCGEYLDIIEWPNGFYLKHKDKPDCILGVTNSFPTKQACIDAWNRRA